MNMIGKYSILEKDEVSGKVLGSIPTIFQIECKTIEEVNKVMKKVEELL